MPSLLDKTERECKILGLCSALKKQSVMFLPNWILKESICNGKMTTDCVVTVKVAVPLCQMAMICWSRPKSENMESFLVCVVVCYIIY